MRWHRDGTARSGKSLGQVAALEQLLFVDGHYLHTLNQDDK